MYSAEEIKEVVERTLGGIKFPESPSKLYKPIAYSLSVGGKRVRPILCLMSSNLFTDRLIDKNIFPAIGIEIFHGFTLIHDDIMDGADVRRNQPTVHKKWNANVAILSGDAMCIEAYKYIAQCDTAKLAEVLSCFSKTATQVCEGQQLDMNYETNPIITEEDYLHMIDLKTSVLAAAAAKIGAITGGASPVDVERMYKFGRNIGLAFQIQDDILDTYGDAKLFGKSIGRDISANKKTHLLVQAIRLVKGEQKQQLTNLLKATAADIDPVDKFTTIKAIYDDLKVKEMSEAKAKEYFDTALNELNAIDVKPERKKHLINFAHELIGREY